MKTLMKNMKKKQNELGIPADKLLIFEGIIDKYFVSGRHSREGDNKFMKAIYEHLTREQRFRLWERWGGCCGTGHDKERKMFALEHAELPLTERLELFLDTIGKRSTKTQSVVLDEENKTITVTFDCHECYERSIKKITTAPFITYYESCAGGRLYVLEKSLGIKLRIKKVDIPKSGISKENPCMFTFDIVE